MNCEISFGSATSAAITGHTTPEDFIRDVQNGRWAKQVSAVRSASSDNAALLKRKLPAVLWGGTFSGRSNKGLIQASGLICADIDKIPQRVGELHDIARNDPHAIAAFVSPSGTGLKIVFRADDFAAVRAHVASHYNAQVDEAAKDVARLCFVSHDPAAFHNPDAVPLETNGHDVEPSPKSAPASSVAPSTRAEIAGQILGVINWTDEGGFCRCPGSHLHTTANGERDCMVMLSGVPTVKCFHDSCAGIIAGINHQLRSEIGKAELPAKRNGIAAEYLPDESEIEQPKIGADAIVLPGGSVTITEAATNLFRRIAPRHKLFTRGKVVVSLQRGMAGTLVLEPVRPSAARSLFESYAHFFAWRVGKNSGQILKPSTIPEETARAMLDCQAATELLPGIAGIVNCPVITEAADGLKICSRGFSQETGLLIVQGERPADVPIDEAVQSLLGLLSEFHFQSDGDKSRAIASFITPALRMGNLIRGFVPADVAEADKSQSGKTYRQKMLAAIYGEKPALVPLKRNGVGSVDESLFEKLVNGRPFIQFDNYRGALDSPALEAFLTAEGSFPCRIPGLREIEVDPSRFFILLTSNGVETTRDLANRSTIIRIFKREGVSFRDTLGDIVNRQPYFLGCVFSVIREWHRQGKPRTSETGHDFREWCQALDWIVQNIFNSAPLVAGHVAAQERVSNPVLTFLRRLALAVANENLLDVPLIASRLFEIADAAEITVPGLRPADAHDTEKGRKVIGTKLAAIFKNESAVNLDGFSIVRGEETHPREDGNGNRLLKVYTFKSPLHPYPLNPYRVQENGPVFQTIPPLEGVEGEVKIL